MNLYAALNLLVAASMKGLTESERFGSSPVHVAFGCSQLQYNFPDLLDSRAAVQESYACLALQKKGV